MYIERGYSLVRYKRYSGLLERIERLNIEDDSCCPDEKRQLLKDAGIGRKIRIRTITAPQIRVILCNLRRSLNRYVEMHAERFTRDVNDGQLATILDGEQLNLEFKGYVRTGQAVLPDDMDKNQIRGIFANRPK